jgi:hypothetical protein
VRGELVADGMHQRRIVAFEAGQLGAQSTIARVVMPLVALGLSLPSTSSTQPRSPWSPWRSPRCRHCCRTGRARLAVIALTAWR